MSTDMDTAKRRTQHILWDQRDIRTGVPSDAYRDNWDRIFGKRKQELAEQEDSE
jgi:hypothetical protein